MEANTDPFSPSTFTINQCVTLKLNENNYLLWKLQFEQFLSSQMLLGFVTGAAQRPPTTIQVRNGDQTTETPNPEYLKWLQKDQHVMAWLFGSLSETALKTVYGLRSSHEVWFSLSKKYNRVSATRKLDLQRKMQSTLKGDRTMSEYLTEMKTICDQLDSIGAPLSEQEKIYGVLNGLGREYQSVCAVIENSMDLFPGPCLEDVFFKLTGFEDKLQKYEALPEVSPHQAFYTNRGGYSNRGRGQNRGGYRGRNSYSTQGRGFFQQFGSNSGRGSYSGGDNYSDSRPTCQICGKYGHAASKCYKRFDQHYQSEDLPQALAAMRMSDYTEQAGREWIPDSAATYHITNSPNNMQQVQNYDGSDAVIVGNGDFLPITHIGSIPLPALSGNLQLNNVLVCPEITKSLLSVSKLTDDYPCKFTFDSKNVYIKDIKTKQVLSRGSKHKGLYRLENPQFMAFYSSRQQSTSDETWHRRLGHPHHQVLKHLSSIKAISVNKTTLAMCESCQLAKVCKLPFSNSVFQATKPLERVHCDVWGPSPVKSVQGFRYYVIFIDNYSRFSWFYPLKLKSEVFSIFKSFQQLVETQYGQKIRNFQSDGGGEFVNKQFLEHFANCGIKHLISCPHTPQQNGLAERKHKHLTELGLSMLFQAQLPQHLWVEALFTANFLSNLLPTSVHQSMTSPYQLLNNKAPIYTALRVFGCACYPYLRPYAQNKLDPRSLLCVFVGYNEKYKGYRCFHPPTGRVYISRHVLFDESRFPYQDLYRSFIPPANSPLLSAWQLGNTAQQNQPAPSPTDRSVTQEEAVVIRTPHHIAPTMQHQHESEPASPIAASSSVTPTLSPSSSTTTSPTNSDSPIFTEEDFPQLSSPQNATNNAHHMMTRAKSGIVKPNPKYILIANKGFPAEPRTIAAALKHPGWTGAMEEEIDTCHETKTWSLEPPPDNANVLGCKWIFKTKIKADGTLDKLRARLVAKGYDQEEGVDFLETFSPVVRTATVRMILHVATVEKWDIKQLDVKNAFLHGDLHETVYMKQPPGFEDKEHPNYVCRLHKAIYGLKQAPRAWFDKFSSYLLNYGFVCSPRDPSLFVYLKNNSIMLLLLYVDDMVLTGNDKTLISDLLKSLGTEFRMKDMGPMAYFLGIQATFTPEGLFLNQEKYAKDLLENAGMLDCAPMPTPLPIQLNRVPYQDKEFEDPTYFRSLAGKLQYLTLTRPDMQFAVNYICQKMHKPSVSDFALLKRTLRYLKGTIDMGLTLSTNTDSVLRAYSDSDHAGCTSTRRSTGGFCTFLGLNLISWSAKRQDSVARSSTEAEYRALSDTAAELSWISSLLKDIGIQQDRPAELYCDNLSAVHLTANPVLHKRSKHFETHYHFAREKVADGSLVIKHVPAWLQLADIFTKSLPQAAFYSLRFKLGVGRCPTSSLRGDVKDSSQAHQESRPMKPKAESRDSTVMLTTKSRASSATSSTVLSPSSIQLTNRYSSLKNMDQ
ncbi:Integrase catalytic core [Arabidopsis suecica]|uniref:Integrase catalytic core n=1 Tax=Arabidopsis suecica TaxID=45249 RepID=A0A8T2AGG8_ARASU|nr:Integrase catalytic core [Arabidopsis suecica]